MTRKLRITAMASLLAFGCAGHGTATTASGKQDNKNSDNPAVTVDALAGRVFQSTNLGDIGIAPSCDLGLFRQITFEKDGSFGGILPSCKKMQGNETVATYDIVVGGRYELGTYDPKTGDTPATLTFVGRDASSESAYLYQANWGGGGPFDSLFDMSLVSVDGQVPAGLDPVSALNEMTDE
jgi:hypothetical protein